MAVTAQRFVRRNRKGRVLTVARELTDAGVRESYRVIEAQEAGLDQFAIHGSLDE